MSEITTVEITRPDQKVLVSRAQAALSVVEGMTIDSDIMYETAGEELNAIKRRAAELDEQRRKITKPLDDAKKAVMDLFRGPLEMLARAESVLKQKMLDYRNEIARRAAAEQAAREEAARIERERLEREAAQLAAAGRAEEAAVKKDIASLVVAAPAEVVAPRVAGVAVRETWDFEVTDKSALIAFVASNPTYEAVLAVDEKALRQLVLAMKDHLPLAGVRVFRRQSISGSRR